MEETLEKYYMAKEKLKDLQELIDYYKETIEDYLNESDRDILRTSRFTVERRSMTTERLSRKNCPPDVWKDYAKEYVVKYITVTKNGEKRRRRSRSRSRE